MKGGVWQPSKYKRSRPFKVKKTVGLRMSARRERNSYAPQRKTPLRLPRLEAEEIRAALRCLQCLLSFCLPCPCSALPCSASLCSQHPSYSKLSRALLRYTPLCLCSVPAQFAKNVMQPCQSNCRSSQTRGLRICQSEHRRATSRSNHVVSKAGMDHGHGAHALLTPIQRAAYLRERHHVLASGRPLVSSRIDALPRPLSHLPPQSLRARYI